MAHHHAFLDADDVLQDAKLMSLGLSLDDIKTIDDFRVVARARACQESAKAGLSFRYHPADPRPAPPAPSEELTDGLASVLQHFRGRGRSRQ